MTAKAKAKAKAAAAKAKAKATAAARKQEIAKAKAEMQKKMPPKNEKIETFHNSKPVGLLNLSTLNFKILLQISATIQNSKYSFKFNLN
jgi:hypothetical protein